MSNNSVVQENEAVVKESKRISKIWVIPLVALSIGLWMIYYQWANQGPLITIQFASATGIEPEKTKVKIRDVQIGLVKSVALKDDLRGVTVTARIRPDAAHLLTTETNFWLVRPRISLSGISGLTTLLSGPYITMEPTNNGEPENNFVALETPPISEAGTPGLQITLNSDAEFAFKEGDPIIYKGLKVGEFEDIYFNLEERIVYYNAFIEAPYNQLITENTKFWNVSGVKFELAANGLEVHTGSLETLLTNGVTFGIPEGIAAGQQITKRAYFDIFRDYEAASNERYKLGVNFVILIKDTVRGLTVGAPVEYRGLEIGRVLEINLPSPNTGEIVDGGVAIPVLITIQPSRVQQADNRQGVEFVRKQTLHWINQGLRASLKMGNLLTGGLYVDLQHYNDVEPAIAQTFIGYDVIPSTGGDFDQITQKVTSVLDNINQIPFKQLSGNANELLTTLAATTTSFKQTAQKVDSLLQDVEDKQTTANINETLSNIDTLLKDFSAGSDTHDELVSTMQELQHTLGQLTPLLQLLNQKPNSLIFAGGTESDIEPKGVNSNKDKDN